MGGFGGWLPTGPGGGAGSLDDLTDVDTATVPPVDGDVLTFDDTSGEWVPAAPSAAPSAAFRGARAYKAGSTQVLTNAALTPITLNAESFDTHGIHDNVTNNSRMLLNRVGYWRANGLITWTGNTTARRVAQLRYNGTTGIAEPAYSAEPGGSGGGVGTPVSSLVYASSMTDYVELLGYQESGGSLSAYFGSQYTFLEVYYLGA